jgi:hypothetical protein
MTYVDHLSSTPVISVPVIEKAKGQDLTYLVAFVGVGLFFSVLSYALTPTEWWPEGAAALAPEMASPGLTLSEIPFPAGLRVAEYPAH